MKINYTEWLKEIIINKKEYSKYDAIVPLSGGKDGSFLLWYLNKYTDLNVLAFHIDNWYVSDGALENAKNMCKKLNYDLMIVRPKWDDIKKVYRKLLFANGEICSACEMMISLYPIECAVEKKIPYIFWGLTPTQVKGKKFESSIQKIDYAYYNKIVKYYEKLLDTILKDEDEENVKKIKSHLLFNSNVNQQQEFPSFVFPFNFIGYDAKEIERIITDEGLWTRPKSTGGTSSNCIINQLHIALKKKIKGDEFYENMMEKKLEANEVTEELKAKAIKCDIDDDIIKKVYSDLEIECSEEELIDHIKNYKKDIILKLESNISQ